MRFALQYGSGIGKAAFVAAFSALGLGKEAVDVVGCGGHGVKLRNRKGIF